MEDKDEITPEKVKSLFTGIGHTIEFHIAQVDSACYPPDKNHGPIRLNSTVAYLYSNQFSSGHRAKKVRELLNQPYNIAEAYVDKCEELKQYQKGSCQTAFNAGKMYGEAIKENERLQIIIEKQRQVLRLINNHCDGDDGFYGCVDMPVELWEKLREVLALTSPA